MSSEWIPVPETEATNGTTIIFPDGFQLSYREMWDLGKPSETEHSRLAYAMCLEHGGNPKAYYNTVSMDMEILDGTARA